MDKLLVRGLKRTEIEPLGLSSLDPDSFYITWAMNETWQLQFTARDDGSVAYNMLDDESSVFYDGQEYIVKQCIPDFVDGTKAKDVVATHVYNEASRIRKYKQYIDTSDPSSGQSTNVKANPDDTGSSGDNSSVTQNGNTTITKTDEGDNQENQIWYSLEDVLKYYLDGNSLGFTYQIIGNFGKSRIEQLQDGNGTDMLSKIVEHWPNAVIFPDNRNIRVYNIDDFEKDYGNRLDYEYNTTEFKLTYDSTSLTNEVFCVGAKYSVETETETDSDSGNSSGAGAQAVIADAKKYLGVPYKYGYGRPVGTANPYNGMDCSSFVSRVYYDFGINIPAYTVAMESCGHEISRDQVQTGDMGFYGSKGASHHICLALDNNTMIYEPQPGEVCKTEPISYYPPTWWERNDDMAKIVAGGSSDDSGGASTSTSAEYYYFAPFWVKDLDSINKYGEHPLEQIEDERFHDTESMRQYALAQLQPEPALTVEVTTYTHMKPIPGDKIHCMIPDGELSTNLAVVGFDWYPLSETNYSVFTLNTNAQNILDYQASQRNDLNKAFSQISKQSIAITNIANNTSEGNGAWNETEVKAFDNSKRS
nr:phage tail protein [Limosilactobacillus mucosae]